MAGEQRPASPESHGSSRARRVLDFLHGRDGFGLSTSGLDPNGLEPEWRTEDELRVGLAAGELVAHYQPIVRIQDGALVGVEALARWQHPTRGLLEPAAFLALAEESGLLGMLGVEMLAQGTANAARWLVRADSRVSVAVNVAPRQLAEPGFASAVRQALTATSVPAGILCLEIIEGDIRDDEESRSVAVLAELDGLGALTISLDDFGVGHSSLGRLRSIPVHQLKIDRSFVVHLVENDRDRVIVAAIVRLAHTLGLSVVAEGVETMAQLTVLQKLGCDLAQGWLFAPAMPASDIDLLVLEATTAYAHLSSARASS